MAHTGLMPNPPIPLRIESRYRLYARPRRSFNSVLDAAEILDECCKRTTSVSIRTHGGSGLTHPEVLLSFEHPLRLGTIREQLRCHCMPEGLRAAHLERTVYNRYDRAVRREEVDFTDETLPLPPSTYPEVTLPFLLSWYPFDGKVFSFHSWTSDRFVARVYYRVLKETKIQLGGKPMWAREAVMYPDLNDWVPLGTLLTTLARPLIPKYRMWFELESPHKVLRYEGPFGPPGAPEVILERL